MIFNTILSSFMNNWVPSRYSLCNYRPFIAKLLMKFKELFVLVVGPVPIGNSRFEVVVIPTLVVAITFTGIACLFCRKYYITVTWCVRLHSILFNHAPLLEVWEPHLNSASTPSAHAFSNYQLYYALKDPLISC